MKKLFKISWGLSLLLDLGLNLNNLVNQTTPHAFCGIVATLIDLICFYIVYDMLKPHYRRDTAFKRYLIRTVALFSTLSLWIYELFLGIPGIDSVYMGLVQGVILTLFVQSLYKFAEEI